MSPQRIKKIPSMSGRNKTKKVSARIGKAKSRVGARAKIKAKPLFQTKSVFRKKTPAVVRKTEAIRRRKPAKIPTPARHWFARGEENPIIAPHSQNGWESWQTFNPTAILLDRAIHFLYRAIGSDGISRLGYAVSQNGLTIDERLPYPVYEHPSDQRSFNAFSYASGGSWGGAEDPRIVHVGDEEVLYMTYTACHGGGLRVGLTSIPIDDFLARRWKWRKPVLISPPGQVHKNWMIFPEKINGAYAILHSMNPEVSITYVDHLDFHDNTWITSRHGGEPRKNCWDMWIRGAGAAPIKTKDGWLLFYHAMDHTFSTYKVGAMLLDAHDPTHILCRSQEPVLQPEESYENNGFKGGVVYASGAVVKDGTLFLYYGGADNYVCVACADLDEFLRELTRGASPKLQRKLLISKKER